MIIRSAPNREWHRWFAWRPVDVDEGIVWLEWIERRWDSEPEMIGASCWDYRLRL